MEPIAALAALLPILTEAGRAAVQRWIAPDNFKATSITDYVALKNADLEMFKAINAAGGSGATYLWVEAVVKLMRPGVAVIVLATWASAHLTASAEVDLNSINNFAGAIGFYLFGDRTLFYARRSA